MDHLYAFYCARYRDIEYNEFIHLGLTEVIRKMNSIPESEPLFKIIKSRTINIAKVKDKEERKYWQEQKKINQIPALYLPPQELDDILKENMRNGKKGFSRI